MSWFISLRKRALCRIYTSSSSPLHSHIFAIEDFLSPDFVHNLDYLQQKENNIENNTHVLQDITNRVNTLFGDIIQSLEELKESILKNVIGSYKSQSQELELIKKEMFTSHQKAIEVNLKNILGDFAETEVDFNDVNPALEEFAALYNKSRKLAQVNLEDHKLTQMDSCVKMLNDLKDKISEIHKNFRPEGKAKSLDDKHIISKRVSEGIFPTKYYNKTEVSTISSRMTSGFLFEQNRNRFVGLLGKQGTLSRPIQTMLVYDIERNKIFKGNTRLAKIIDKRGLSKYSKDLNLLCLSKPSGQEVMLYKLFPSGPRRILTITLSGDRLSSGRNTIEILDGHQALLICFEESLGVYDIIKRTFIQKIMISRITDMIYAKDINLIAVLAHQSSSDIFYLFKLNERGELIEWKEKICLIPKVFYKELSKISYDKGVFLLQGENANDDYNKLFIIEVLANNLQISTHLLGFDKGPRNEVNPFVLLPEENKILNFGSEDVQEFDWKTRSLSSRDQDQLFKVLVDNDGIKVFYRNAHVSLISRKTSLE